MEEIKKIEEHEEVETFKDIINHLLDIQKVELKLPTLEKVEGPIEGLQLIRINEDEINDIWTKLFSDDKNELYIAFYEQVIDSKNESKEKHLKTYKCIISCKNYLNVKENIKEIQSLALQIEIIDQLYTAKECSSKLYDLVKQL